MPDSAAPNTLPAAWHLRLTQAQGPLSPTALCGHAPRPADRVRLRHLLAQGALVNLGSPRLMALVTADDALGRFAPRQLARAAVLAHVGWGLRPLALSDTALAKVRLPAFARRHLRVAVADLVAQGQLVPLQLGRQSWVIGAAGIQHHLAQTQASAPAPSEPLTPARLRQAYADVLLPGGSMVELAALHRQLGGDLAALHTTLRQMLAEHQLFLVRGEPSVLSAAEQAAGLTIDGQTYHCIELRQD